VVERQLETLRNLASRGLPEAVELLDAHPAARPPDAARRVAAFQSPLEFHFRALVREGIAQPGRGRDDYVDVNLLPHARGNLFTARLRGTTERCVLKRFVALGTAADGFEV
jgi:hypothetical protein